MLIGRSDDPQNPRRVAATKVTFPFGSGSRNPSGPAAAGRTNRPDTRPQTAPHQDSFRSPLAPTGPSTHALRVLSEIALAVAIVFVINPQRQAEAISYQYNTLNLPTNAIPMSINDVGQVVG